MKKLLVLLALLLCVCAFAQADDVKTVSFLGVTVPVDAEHVDLGNKAVRNFDALEEFLDQLPNLKSVDMYNTKMYRKYCDRLSQRYPDVKWGWTLHFGDGHTLRNDAKVFSTLHNNRSKTHSSIELSILKYCPGLVALDIGHNRVDDLSFLYDLPNLKVLIVACNAVTDITPIGSLKDLEYLEIFKNKIKDISPLAGLTNLVDLNICFNYIGDWTPIHGLTKLERLWLYNSNNYSDDRPVPTSVVNELKEKLPDCYIDYRSYSTNGGWREHPRYDVIYEMFKSGQYIAFPTAEEIAAMEAAK